MNQLQSWYYRQPPALRVILAINVTVYVLAQFLRVLWPGGLAFMLDHFALHATFPDILLQPWQLVTYNFMHTSGGFGGLLHIAFNMLWLFWIGREYEEMHGSERTWTLYILAGVGGGLVSLLLMPLGVFGNPNVPIVGASASVLGVLMAVAILYPYKQIALLFIGVVRLIWVVIGFLVIDILINLGSNSVALTAHWGGAISGYLFAKAERGGVDLTGWTRIFRKGSGKRSGRRGRRKDESLGLLGRLEVWLGGNPNPEADTGSPSSPSASSSSAARPSGGSTSTRTSTREEEIDRILEKISEKGYDALTDEEKRTLYEASQD
ncbi:rhomboid family intramembrane serine protease [Longibacter sp.]|uniref:rhomboid family intramembrane serine protease n=1 Tax=Longibacter sp. TaxID=2045415 RepID=UPI003EBB31BC